jgi:16S rRNA (guanine527-N7)-methyltransferase
MFKEELAREFAPYGELSEIQLTQLESHYRLLKTWNQRLNLTRIVGLEESIQFHYCESLFLARFLPRGPLRIVDVGSGAGFPGIPVAIFRPDCELTLVESHKRKSVFLREASREIKNITVVAKRAEDVVEKFDWLVSRAVAPAEVLRLDCAKSVALLIAEEDASHLKGTFAGVPWGKHRVVFHVKHQS